MNAFHLKLISNITLFFFIAFSAKSYSGSNKHFTHQKDKDGIRLGYRAATENKDNALKFYDLVANTTLNSDPVMIAYKGGSLALLTPYEKLTERKKKLDEAISWIETAVKKAPYDPEIRLIRLSVQENLPRFLKYNKNLDEDRKIVEQARKDTHDESFKKMIDAYFAKFNKKSL